jgi:uncharacterized protein YndB with AHSA1/START domain
MMTESDQKVLTSERELILTRTFDAPRELVFAAYSSCEHLSNWWGPRSWPLVECTMDFRVGGVWHYCLRGPDKGDESWGRAVFDEISEPERIVYTDAFADADGNVNEGMPRTQSIVELAEVDGKTRLTLRATYPSPADLQTVLDMGMVAGITETLDRLAEHLVASMSQNAAHAKS